MKREENALLPLQDFIRNVGISPLLKRDNSRTETGENRLILNDKYISICL